MAGYFAGNSCDVYTPESMACTLGNYVNYAINVTEPADISKGIRFAAKNNVRLVIRNTGHDYNGKSTGAGALGIWTHHLKDVDLFDYNSTQYQGKAIKMGAGIQGFEAAQAAQDNELTVVGGECPTVGLAGGYTQGGGHSPLASRYGMAADQALEWEVVTGAGELVKASATENADLYWALSGGGGGTYGVVYSLTSKAHALIPSSGANLTFSSTGLSKDIYFEAVAAWHTTLPGIVDAGGVCEWFVSADTFLLTPFSGPGIPAKQAVQLLKPFTDTLQKLNVTYAMVGPTDFPSYLDMFHTFVGNLDIGTDQYVGSLIPRSVVEGNNEGLTAAIRNIVEDPATTASFFGVGLNVNKSIARGNENVQNALLPAWRGALISGVVETPYNFSAPLSDTVALQKKMTDDFLPQLEALSPAPACYMNEADPSQPNFQEVFYGANYEKLLSIKAKYDPDDIFYALGAVGSDRWAADIAGRLCKV